jgi:hypothetical protein
VISIRFALRTDITPLMQFIKNHWSGGHVLAHSQELMDWQHGGTDGREHDYVIAADGSDIVGILGFILTSRFDPTLTAARVIWLAMWKIRDGAPAGLGLKMLSFLEREIPHSTIGTVGINDHVAKLYTALGYRVGSMQHWYVLNPRFSEFSIAQVPKNSQHAASCMSSTQTPTLRALDRQALKALRPLFYSEWAVSVVPRKTPEFFETRYLGHPFYQYTLYSVERDGHAHGLLATRLCRANGACVLRVVDGILPPSALPNLGFALQERVKAMGAEYADLYEFGLDNAGLKASGFLLRPDACNDVVIPNYFEPFRKNNISVKFSFKVIHNQRLIVHKADADQDRPNHIE